jgi:hypothetical protein
MTERIKLLGGAGPRHAAGRPIEVNAWRRKSCTVHYIGLCRGGCDVAVLIPMIYPRRSPVGRHSPVADRHRQEVQDKKRCGMANWI